MILILIFLPVFYTLYKIFFDLFDKKAKRRMEHVNNVAEAVAFREKLVLRRKYLLYSFVAITLILTIIISIINNKYIINNIIFIIVLFLSIKYDYSKTAFYGNISYDTPETFLDKHEKFFLYLRGFDSDIPFDKDRVKTSQLFNESVFVEAIEYTSKTPCCALGICKEIDSPIGANRVYVDDDEWKEKVLMLMNKAEKIFILVNNRSSCIWEIEQSATLLNKTIFIVDNYEKYQSIRNHFIDIIDMPEIPNEVVVPFFFENGKKAIHFNNTWEGYFDILGLDPEVIEKRKVEERTMQIQTNSENYLRWVIVIIIIVFLVLYFNHK